MLRKRPGSLPADPLPPPAFLDSCLSPRPTWWLFPFIDRLLEQRNAISRSVFRLLARLLDRLYHGYSRKVKLSESIILFISIVMRSQSMQTSDVSQSIRRLVCNLRRVADARMSVWRSQVHMHCVRGIMQNAMQMTCDSLEIQAKSTPNKRPHRQT